MHRTMIKDEDWARIEPLFPKKQTKRGRPSTNNRMMIEGILWVLRTGAPWRDMPKTLPPWQSVYTRFRRWSKQGLWDILWENLKKRCRPRVTYPGLFDGESPSARLQSLLQREPIEREHGKIGGRKNYKNSCRG